MASVQNLIVKIGADISGLTRGIQNATRQVTQLARDNEKAFKATKSVGKAMLAVGTVGVAGLGMAVKVAADFESSMSRVGALSGATSDQMKLLTKEAERLGATTSFSATEAAEGMQFLAMAGYKTNDIVAAMPGLLATAAAGQEDLGRTADIVSNILTGFGIKASETGRVADVLTKAFTNSNTDLNMLGQTMKYVAPVAKASGQSLEGMAAAAGILGNAGIQADQAGTSLRMMLIRLAKPPKMARDALSELGVSVSDSKGNMKDLSQVIGEMVKATKGMTEADKLAAVAKISGTEASAAMLALMDAGQGTIEKFTKELENSGGTAEEIAKKQLDNLKGQLIILTSALEGAAISIGNALLPALKVIVTALTKATEWFNGLSESSKKFIAVGAAVASLFALMVGPLLILIGMIPSITAGFGAIAGALGMTSGALLTSIALWGGIALAIIAIGSALYIAYNEVEGFRNAVNAAWQWIINATKTVGSALKSAFGSSVDWIVQKFDELKGLAVIVGAAISNVAGVIKGKFSSISSAIGGAASGIFGSFIAKASEFLAAIKGLFTGDAEALVPIITTLGPTIIGLLVGGIPGILISASRFLPAIADGIASGTPSIVEVINNVVRVIIDFLQNSLPNLITMGLEIVLNLINGILASLPTLINVAVTIISTLIETLATLIPQLLTMGIQLLTTLLEGLVSALPLIVDATILVIDSLTNTFLSNLPTIMDAGINILTALIEGISTALPMLLGLAVVLITEIATGLLQSLPKILDAGMKILMALISGILQILPQLIATALTLIVKIVSVLIANLPKIISSGIKILTALISGILQILPQLIATALKLIVQIATILIQNLPKILSAGKDILLELIKGIISIVSELASAIFTKVIPAITDKLESIDMLTIGKNIIEGLINGLGSMTGLLKEKIAGMAKLIPDGIKKLLGIHSPSRVTTKLGEYTGQGLANGLSKKSKAVAAAAKKTANEAIKNLELKYDTKKISPSSYISGLKNIQKNLKLTGDQSRKVKKEIFQANEAINKQAKTLKTTVSKINSSVKTADANFLEKVKSINAKLASDVKKVQSDFKKELTDLGKSIYNQTSLFSGVKTEKKDGNVLLNNLKSQNKQFKQWQKDLSKIQKTGVSKTFVDELREMGVSSADEIRAIASMPKNMLNQYVKAWKEKHTLANSEANTQMAQAKKDMEKQIKNLNEGAKKELVKAKSDWVAKIKTFSSDIQKLGDFKNSGKVLAKNTVEGLIRGLGSMRGPLANESKKLAKTIERTIKSTLKIKSPSRVMRDEIGKYIPLGLIAGIEGQISRVKSATNRLSESLIPDTSNLSMAYDSPNVTSAGVLGVNHSFDDDTQATNAMSRVEQLLEQLLQKDQSLVINGREFAVATYNDYDNYGGNKRKLAERWG